MVGNLSNERAAEIAASIFLLLVLFLILVGASTVIGWLFG